MLSNIQTLLTAFLSVAVFDAAVGPITRVETTTQTLQLKGIDITDTQGPIDWSTVAGKGVAFAYIETTEGKDNKNERFRSQFDGAGKANIIRGGYHVALPDTSNGKQQAGWFIENGGGWTADGKTLPGALKLLDNPHGKQCYGLNNGDMIKWIQEFSKAYYSKVKRYPVIHTTDEWWIACTGNSGQFGPTSPLWVRHHSDTAGELPAGWKSYKFWQYAGATADGPVPGNQDYYNGGMDSLKNFAVDKNAK